MSPFRITQTMSTDAQRRTLHLLPALQTDPFDRVVPGDISLTITLSWLNEPVSPSSGWIIRQPYPNQLYFVGGSDDCHLGHFVSLPEDQLAGEVVFHWTVAAPGVPPGSFQVSHRLDLAFNKGVGQVYSMDVANWWTQSEFFSNEHATPEIGRNRFSRLKSQGVSPVRRACVDESIREGCRHVDIHESLSLPAITLNDCWTIERYGGDAGLASLEVLR
ncbi:hypothetical protein FGL86_05835 [Pistricoccus aurantiacus]|uniref:Uncharacterized protein n=1 Tax=Pistricoccus aurantiacus TaxID=1883414 RepID=A0A5B8SQY6_9GAMM|nr:hypothetical protein [Pistricoccus aurantiacus]QEA38644.1 hypothetical protein FGL86_05835 [Pistricoccus aurantiacus]